MDYYDHDDRKRDKHREHKKSKSSHHKSHKQFINEYLGDSQSRTSEASQSSSSHKRSRTKSKSKSRERSEKHHKHHHHSHSHKSHSSSSETKQQQPQQQQQTYQNQQSQKYEDSYNHMDSFKHYAGTPSSTVMLRQLPLYISETDLRAELTIRSVPFRECRLVKSRETGTSRGFAFIEFNSIEEAQSWLEESQGFMSICESRVQLYYSQPKYDDDASRGRRAMNSISTDWDCFKCGIKNFKRRDCCFKCSTTREDSEKMREGEGYDHVGSTPCNTLILRGLDALSADETIRLAISTLTNVYPKNVHIAKDSLTSISSGFGFVELNSIQEATIVLQILQNVQPVFEIDGKQINVDYSKNNYTTAITQVGTKIMYPLASHNSYDNHYDNNKFHNNNNNHNSTRNKGNQADQANSAAAVAQAALKNMQKKQDLIYQLKGGINNETSLSIKAYVTPDVSTYTYDEVSGYYYDSITGYYYDANSQYYYNSQTQQYMYWDAASFSYIIVNNEQNSSNVVASKAAVVTSSSAASSVDTYTASYVPYSSGAGAATVTSSEETKQTIETVENENKKSKETNAAEIAKKMEKWAETMNKKKGTVTKQKPQSTPTASTTTTTTSSTVTTLTATPTIATISNFINNANTDTTATISSKKDAATVFQQTNKKVLEPIKNEQQSENKIQAPPPSQIQQQQDTVLEADKPKEEFDEKKFIDNNKMACLLCKRGFDSIELLNKHVQLSALHKTNLEKYKQSNQQNASDNSKETSDSLLAAIQYRDRAKERRDKYGTPEPPFKSDVRDRLGIDTTMIPEYVAPVPAAKQESTSEPKSNDSFGSKLMRKMGWSEGSGLGKKNQGISVPIEASVRQRGLGLGASGVEFDPNDTYKECVKKSARARFESLKN